MCVRVNRMCVRDMLGCGCVCYLSVSPSGHPPTLSHRRSSDSYLSVVILPPCEAFVVGIELRSEAAQTLTNCGAPKARWEVVVGAPKASWELNW